MLASMSTSTFNSKAYYRSRDAPPSQRRTVDRVAPCRSVVRLVHGCQHNEADAQTYRPYVETGPRHIHALPPKCIVSTFPYCQVSPYTCSPLMSSVHTSLLKSPRLTCALFFSSNLASTSVHLCFLW